MYGSNKMIFMQFGNENMKWIDAILQSAVK